MNVRRPGTRRTTPAPLPRPHTADMRPSTCYLPCEQLLAGWIAGASRRRQATPHRHQQPTQRATTMNHARTRIRTTRRVPTGLCLRPTIISWGMHARREGDCLLNLSCVCSSISMMLDLRVARTLDSETGIPSRQWQIFPP
jgi:hypothetical protein